MDGMEHIAKIVESNGVEMEIRDVLTTKRKGSRRQKEVKNSKIIGRIEDHEKRERVINWVNQQLVES